MSPSVLVQSNNNFDFGIKSVNSAMEKMSINKSHNQTSGCASKPFSCTRISDECLFHCTVQSHSLYNGPKGKQIQLHILRKPYFPHTPYLYCPSGEKGTEDYIDLPSYLPAVSKNPSGSTISKASTFYAGDWDHHVAEVIYDYDFGDPDGRRVGLFFVKPRWKQTPQNIVLNFHTGAEATLFLRHLLGVMEFQSSGETSCLLL